MSYSEDDEFVILGEENNSQDQDDDSAIRQSLYEEMPPQCMGYDMKLLWEGSKPKREPEPTQVIPPDLCFRPCPRIISRKTWGAKLPKKQATHMMYRVRPAVFKQSDCYSCGDEFTCTKNLQLLQIYQMDYLGFTDIAYSFMIGEDGNIYEGRGWGTECEKASGFMGIGFLGYYTDEGDTKPTDEMLLLAYDLIMCGVRKGFLANPFTLWGNDESPLEMMRAYVSNEESVDYKTKVEDLGIY